MERISIPATVAYESLKVTMPIETDLGVSKWRECNAIKVFGKLYQVEFRKGVCYGTDLATLDEVILDIE